jgi:hypothetical protein
MNVEMMFPAQGPSMPALMPSSGMMGQQPMGGMNMGGGMGQPMGGMGGMGGMG